MTIEELEEREGFCRRSTQTSTSAANSSRCDRREVEQAWLERNPKVRSLKIALDDLSDQIDAIFASSDLGPSDQETETRAIGAKDIFLAGKLRLGNLIESQSLLGKDSNDACKRCVEIADWSTLNRIAIPTKGVLNHSTKKNPATGAQMSLRVATLDSAFISTGRANIQRIRDYIALIANDPLGSDDVRKKLRAEVDVLVEAFQNRSFGVGLAGIKSNYQCIGFENTEK